MNDEILVKNHSDSYKVTQWMIVKTKELIGINLKGFDKGIKVAVLKSIWTKKMFEGLQNVEMLAMSIIDLQSINLKCKERVIHNLIYKTIEIASIKKAL